MDAFCAMEIFLEFNAVVNSIGIEKRMKAREEDAYAKGIAAYDVWKTMLLDEKWFENGNGFDELFSKLLVQNDAMVCIADGRKWAAEYFQDLSEKYGVEEKSTCLKIAEHFKTVSGAASEMMTLIGDWSDIDKMLDNFGDRSVREKISELLDQAKEADIKAYDQIMQLLSCI